MSGVERDQNRVKATGEVFTPTEAVQKMLDTLPEGFFEDTAKTALDPACGDGAWLGEVLIRKLECVLESKGSLSKEDFKLALSNIYGTDLMEDNVRECKKRLLCEQEDLVDIVNTNIVCRSALEYDFSFNGTNRTNKELEEERKVLAGLVPKIAPKKIKKIKKTLTPTTFNSIF